MRRTTTLVLAGALLLGPAGGARAASGTGGARADTAVPSVRAAGGAAFTPPSRRARSRSRSRVRTRVTPAPAPTPAPVAGVFPVAGPHVIAGADGRFGAGRPGHVHEGQDVLAAEGLPVVAALPGTVAFAQYQAGGAGEYVVVDHDDGRATFYAHCRRGSTTVAPGQRVAAGAPLCAVGATGAASGPHLHFELWIGGWRDRRGHPVDPLPFLRGVASRG